MPCFFGPSKKKKKKGSGKGRGRNNPGGTEDTFKRVLNRDDVARSGDRGALPPPSHASATSASSARSAATARAQPRDSQAPQRRQQQQHGGWRTPGGGSGGGGGGFTPSTRIHVGGGARDRITTHGVGQWGGGAPGVGHGHGHGGGRRSGGAVNGMDWRTGGGGGGRRFDSASDCVRVTEGMVLFWKEPACFVQWTPSSFEVDGVRYCNAEQWMMATKAKVFDDQATLERIMATSDPRQQKALGRQVKGFDAAVWDKVGYDVVVTGNLAKFRQNPVFREELLATGDKILAEASPYDSEWGIGLHADDANVLVQTRWPGKNKLGEALMDVRSKLRYEAYGEEVDDYGDDDDDDFDERGQEGGKEEREGGCSASGRGVTVSADEDWDMGEAFNSDHDENETIGTHRRRSGK